MRPRRSRVLGWCAIAIAVVQAAPALATTAGVDAVVAIQASLDVEHALLREDTERFDRLSTRRDRAMERLTELYRSLDVAVRRTDEAGPEAVETIMERIDQADRERASMLAQERILVERIGERLRRIAMLENQVASLSEETEQTRGVLAGTWQVTLRPLAQQGRFRLSQTGTLVTGTYTLDGGWSGSLQGTLVDRKVYLVRIDSKLGRSMELQGELSADGQGILGTWLNYELAGQAGSTGQWSARRVPGDR